MALRVVRLGTPRVKDEGLRIGAVRLLPRGVKKTDYARLDYFDAWLPELSPSAKLLKWVLEERPPGAKRWALFERKYRREMAEPERARLLHVLARLSHDTDFSVGCYCEDPQRCHRTILKALFDEHGARIVGS